MWPRRVLGPTSTGNFMCMVSFRQWTFLFRFSILVRCLSESSLGSDTPTLSSRRLLGGGVRREARACAESFISLTRSKEPSHIYVQTQPHACMHAYIHTYIHTFTRTCMHTHMHGYIHKFIHTCTHTFIHTCIHTCMHTHARINNHSMPWADQYLDPGDRSPCPALTPPYVDWLDTDSIYAPHRRDPRGAMPRRTMRNV